MMPAWCAYHRCSCFQRESSRHGVKGNYGLRAKPASGKSPGRAQQEARYINRSALSGIAGRDSDSVLTSNNGIAGYGRKITDRKMNRIRQPQISCPESSCLKRPTALTGGMFRSEFVQLKHGLPSTKGNSGSIQKTEADRTHTRMRLLFTMTLVATLTAFAVWSDSHSRQLTEIWRNGFGFSALSLAELRWHQTLTSLVLTAGERHFVQSILMLCISVGLCEWKFGSRTAVKVFFTSHLTVTIGLAMLVVLPMHLCGVEWATALASERDVGPSAGYYGCLGVVVASMPHQKRTWLILFFIAVLTGRLAISSASIYQHPAVVSADVAHLAAFPFGMLLAYFTGATVFAHPRR